MAAPGARRSELQLRVMSGLVLAALALTAVFLGGTTFALFCAAMAFIVFREWSAIAGLATFPKADAMATGLMLLALVPVVLLPGWAGAMMVALAAALAAYVLTKPTTEETARWAGIAIVYCAAGAASLVALRESGAAAVIVLFAIVWGTDIGAYFVGRAIGGPKLAPKISPGKTQSGALGGLAIAAAAAMLAGVLTGFGSPALILVAALVSAVSQAGDLFESFLKRRFGVKDSGWILPGHGGMFDRVDGLIPAAIIFFLAARALAWV